MWKIEPFSFDDLKRFDALGNIIKCKCGNKTEFFENPEPYFKTSPDVLLDRYTSLMDKQQLSNYAPYLDYNKEMMAKYGPQGGNISCERMREMLIPYYEAAQTPVHFDEALIRGRDLLMKIVQERLERVGYPVIPESVPNYDTYAGTPTGLRKGNYHAEVTGASTYRHAYPIVVGTRRMRGKDRLIFMDSVLNVRMMEKYLTAARFWLRENLPEFFGAWVNPNIHVHPRTKRLVDLGYTIIEADYKAMDTGMSWSVVETIILPVLELVLGANFTPYLAAHLEEVWNVPVIDPCGEGIIYGKHNMLSGINPTNDFETIYTVCLALGAAITVRITVEDLDLLALGDDMRMGFKGPQQKAVRLFEEYKALSEMAGLHVHGLDSGKAFIGSGSCRFLRRVYTPKGKLNEWGVCPGSYPSVLALNNIVQPEFPSKSYTHFITSMCQRLDNLTTNPEYIPFVQFILKNLRKDAKPTRDFALNVLSAAKPERVDWWERLYGERWDPISSASYRTLLTLL